MNTFHLNDRQEYLQVGYAPSNRAKCRKCKDKIDLHSLRIGICIDDDHYAAQYWYHFDCFQLSKKFKHVNPKEQIYQLDQLEEADYDKVVKNLEQQVERLKNGEVKKKPPAKPVKKPSKSKSKSVQSESDQYSDDESDEDFNAKGKVAQKSKKIQSKSKPKAKEEKSAEKKRKKIPKKEVKVTGGYTKEQEAQFQALREKYQACSINQLKEYLALNHQSKTGAKPELVQKCADGQLLGKIPGCMSCGGGRLRFDRKTGIYKCPGYMDDDIFKHCGVTFGMADIKRQPWVKP